MAGTLDILAFGPLVWETTVRVGRLPDDATLDRVGVDAALAGALEVRHDGGGSAANTLAVAARLGLRCVFVGACGDDEPGRRAAASLAAAGVDVRVRVAAGRTTKRNTVLVEDGTGRTAFRACLPPGVAPPVRPREVPADLLAAAGILHLDRVSETGLALALARSGRPVSLDLHTAPGRAAGRARLGQLLPALAVLQVSGGAARDLATACGWPPGAAAAALALADRVPRVAVTLGGDGAVACARGARPFAVPAVPPARLVDPTGAGDAFAAGLLAGVLAGHPLERCVDAAVRLGSDACGTLGGRRSC